MYRPVADALIFFAKAPTAASNELITPGGEVAFVGQMMDESAELQERCAWYTSLLGKASSIAPLISRLKAGKVRPPRLCQ